MSRQARQILEEGRREIAALDERIRRHAFLDLWAAGQANRTALGVFATQQQHVIESDLRSVALVVARAASAPTREYFLGMLQGERAALAVLPDLAAAAGLAAGQLGAAEPLPGAFAYSAYVAWLAQYGTAAEFAGAFLVNLEAWGANCGRMSRALRERYGCTAKDTAFLDLFATSPPNFEERGLAVLEEGLARGVTGAAIRRAARLLQGYELLYWDTMLQATQAPQA
jgi:pyrroloquinoline quinone (PQQ) biosynthesis protein C